MVSCGISEVVIASVDSEKTHLKKLMMIRILLLETEKPLLLNEKRRCRFLTTCNPMSRCLSAPDATSLPPEPSSILYYLKLNSGIGH